MNEPTRVDDALSIVASILIRCFVLGLLCMILWVVVVATAPDWAYGMHSRFFPITRAQFMLVHYAGLVMFKVAVFGFTLLPYLGIKLVQRKRKASQQSSTG